MRFVFCINKFEATEDSAVFRVMALTAYARTMNEAHALIANQVPEGHRIFEWHTEPWNCCSACGGPFHPATGHQPKEGGRWCGPCAREAVQMMVETRHRWCNGEKFYQHAYPPPA